MHPLHHVGYWVDDLDEAVDRAVRTLGVGPFLVHRNIRFLSFTLADGTEITEPAWFDHTAAFASWGSIVLELGVVHSADPWIIDAYRIRPGAVGHVSWVVDDLDAESARLRAAGDRLLYDEPRRGTSGSRINFVHPRDAGGVLVELVEHPKGGSTS